MTSETERLRDLDARYLWHPFTPMRLWVDSCPLIIASAEGNELIDTDGRRYLDGVSSLWCNVHGHRHPALDAAIRAQLDKVAHTTLLGLGNVPAIELAEALVKVAPAGLTKVFYSDSGSSAVEIAVKLAFQAQQLRGNTKRTRFLALSNAYHGDTLGAVSVGGIDLFHQLFQPLLFRTARIEAQLEALDRVFESEGDELAAFILEPLIQGAAGMLTQPAGFLRRARELCDRHGVLLICDEVATGFGRTGTMFACEQESVSPDLLCVAKGITGGYLPLAATLTSEALYETFLGATQDRTTFFHGHTYTGNPLACAVALASLRIFEEDGVIAQVQKHAAHLERRLAAEIAPLRAVRAVRQRGFMVGIELVDQPARSVAMPQPLGAEVCQRAREAGVILRPLGSVVVLMPPLSFHVEQLDRMVGAVRDAIIAVLGDDTRTSAPA